MVSSRGSQGKIGRMIAELEERQRAQQEEAQREKEQQKRLILDRRKEKLKTDLVKNGCYIFIEKYVAKYGKNVHERLIQEYTSQKIAELESPDKLNTSPDGNSVPFWHAFDNSNISILSSLLSQKSTCQIDLSTLNSVVMEEVENYSYKIFKERMTYNQPKDIDEYLYNLLNIYGVCYPIYMGVFFRLIDELNVKYAKSSIRRKISSIQKQIEISNFEKFLLSDITASIEDIDRMSGYDFERFLKSLFTNKGYLVEHTSLSNDQGADLVALMFGIKTVIQAKRSSSKIGNKAIQECVAAINHYQAHNGMVITNSVFTAPAIRLARSNGITLIDRTELSRMLTG